MRNQLINERQKQYIIVVIWVKHLKLQITIGILNMSKAHACGKV